MVGWRLQVAAVSCQCGDQTKHGRQAVSYPRVDARTTNFLSLRKMVNFGAVSASRTKYYMIFPKGVEGGLVQIDANCIGDQLETVTKRLKCGLSLSFKVLNLKKSLFKIENLEQAE